MSSPDPKNLYSAKVASIRREIAKLSPDTKSTLPLVAIGLIWLAVGFFYFKTTLLDTWSSKAIVFAVACVISYFIYVYDPPVLN